ncbi:MAG: DUF1905 domain-containing protein [Beijerinckiaceae bacterium]|nr:DUF1905 domain-containing protein [Beijerinckiaceae bacterium]MCZ8301832.1 DUF1905 domain-containing protein [Beijerinckiaceae bacterium]
MIVEFTAPLKVWSGPAAWFFVALPQAEAGMIRMAVPRRGFGSVRVKARIGEARWTTSIFPDTKAGTYLLPVKAAIRKAERLSDGDPVTVELLIDA